MALQEDYVAKRPKLMPHGMEDWLEARLEAVKTEVCAAVVKIIAEQQG